MNPPTAAALIVRFAEPPGATVALAAERFREKPEPAAAAGAMAANTAVALPPVAGKFG